MIILTPTVLEAKLIFGATVVPALESCGFTRNEFNGIGVQIGVVGIGLAAAGAGAAYLLQQLSLEGQANEPVVLAGIAGSLAPTTVPVGSVLVGEAVLVDGIGMGRGASLRTPAEIGFSQRHPWRVTDVESIEQELLYVPEQLKTDAGNIQQGSILSVAVSSGTVQEANNRLSRYPNALVEEMEGYSVALACGLSGQRLSIIRGVSNEAGNVDTATWDIEGAATAVAGILSVMVGASV